MALTINTQITDQKYILEADRQSKNPTIFTFKVLTLAEMVKIHQHTSLAAISIGSKENDPAMGIENVLAACSLGIRKIQGLVDANGDPIDDMPVDQVLSSINDPQILAELTSAIVAANSVNKAQEKNFVGLPKPGQPVKPAKNVPALSRAARRKQKKNAKKRSR
jgi:hypothetical protein